jgi:hypothetical protein
MLVVHQVRVALVVAGHASPLLALDTRHVLPLSFVDIRMGCGRRGLSWLQVERGSGGCAAAWAEAVPSPGLCVSAPSPPGPRKGLQAFERHCRR